MLSLRAMAARKLRFGRTHDPELRIEGPTAPPTGSSFSSDSVGAGEFVILDVRRAVRRQDAHRLRASPREVPNGIENSLRSPRDSGPV